MNWFDILLAFLVLAAVGMGFCRGFARTVGGFVASIAAVVCALWFYAPLGYLLHPYVGSRLRADAIGFALVFGAMVVLVAVLEWFLIRLVKIAHLTWLDRSAGAAFGIVQGLLWAAAVVVAVLVIAPRPLPNPIVNSRLIPYFERAGRVLASAAPEPVREGYRRAHRDLEKVLPPPLQKHLERISY